MTGHYRALVCHALSDDFTGLRVAALPVAQPGPGEVRVRLRAAAVNFPDVLITQGRYQHKPALPFVPGVEAAGELICAGPGVAAPAPGAAVVVACRTGAFAEEIVVPATAVRPMPPGLDFAHAAALRAASVTAYVALVRRAQLQPGEHLLVHGASGGAGMAAVQLGRHLGATVIATGTSDDKLAVVRDQGAHHVLNLRGPRSAEMLGAPCLAAADARTAGVDAAAEDAGAAATRLRDRVHEWTGGRGADVVFDPVGGDVFDASVRCIAWGGRLLVVGFASGRIPVVRVNLPLIKGFSIIGVRAGEFGRRDPVAGAQALDAVDALAAQGVLRPYLCARLPLAQAVDALRMLSERRVVGKVVIET